ncbi:MAG: NADH-quinone oxidoreductase subunit NuoE [Deltaproteobacteria bacterium]|nr:NADH-quinone oxidoreductase subunit NuoE [Deltaproteobacteria bacterium]
METVTNNREQLIPLLQQVQRREGYVSHEAATRIADQLKIAESEVFGVASFYAQFKFYPPGKNAVRVCLGTACHVRGGQVLLSALERDLGIGPGQTTKDRQFDLDRVACLGCCALAPVVTVNDEILGQVNPNKLSAAIRRAGKSKAPARGDERESDPAEDGKE